MKKQAMKPHKHTCELHQSVLDCPHCISDQSEGENPQLVRHINNVANTLIQVYTKKEI
jgi:hypothetical protein